MFHHEPATCWLSASQGRKCAGSAPTSKDGSVLFQHLPPPHELNHASVSRIKSKRDFRECGVFVLFDTPCILCMLYVSPFLALVAPLDPVRGVQIGGDHAAHVLAAIKTLSSTH